MAFCVVTGVRPHAAHLREVLLLVADPLHELLDRDGPAVLEAVLLRLHAHELDQHVGVRREPGHGAHDVRVDGVDLLAALGLGEQLGHGLLLGRDHDAVLGEHADAGAGVVDGLRGTVEQ